MSTGYLLQDDGSYALINDEILDDAGTLQTDIDDFIITGIGSIEQIFFTDGIPVYPVLGTGSAELFTSWHESTTYISYDERVFLS